MELERLCDILETKKVRFRSLFHFTDSRNLVSIRKHGILSLRELRKFGIPIEAPGGNQWSHEADERCGLDSYVHLCFHDQHPMAYTAVQQGRIKDVVFLKIDVRIILEQDVLVSMDVSNKTGIKPKLAAEAVHELDLRVIYEKTDWRDPEVKARLHATRKYEVLVPNMIPVSAIKDLRHG